MANMGDYPAGTALHYINSVSPQELLVTDEAAQKGINRFLYMPQISYKMLNESTASDIESSYALITAENLSKFENWDMVNSYDGLKYLQYGWPSNLSDEGIFLPIVEPSKFQNLLIRILPMRVLYNSQVWLVKASPDDVEKDQESHPGSGWWPL